MGFCILFYILHNVQRTTVHLHRSISFVLVAQVVTPLHFEPSLKHFAQQLATGLLLFAKVFIQVFSTSTTLHHILWLPCFFPQHFESHRNNFAWYETLQLHIFWLSVRLRGRRQPLMVAATRLSSVYFVCFCDFCFCHFVLSLHCCLVARVVPTSNGGCHQVDFTTELKSRKGKKVERAVVKM